MKVLKNTFFVLAFILFAVPAFAETVLSEPKVSFKPFTFVDEDGNKHILKVGQIIRIDVADEKAAISHVNSVLEVGEVNFSKEKRIKEDFLKQGGKILYGCPAKILGFVDSYYLDRDGKTESRVILTNMYCEGRGRAGCLPYNSVFSYKVSGMYHWKRMRTNSEMEKGRKSILQQLEAVK